MRVGLLGGTFDPIHNAHLKLARAAVRQLHLDRLYFVLSPRSPFKLGRALTPTSLRLRMLRSALPRSAKFQIGRWELKRRGPSYTVRTVRDYKRRHANDQLFLILGSDAYNGFRRWRSPNEIRKLATIVVGRRPGAKIRNAKGATVLKGTFPDISATRIRTSLREREADTPSSVRALIRRKGLYQ